MTLRAILFDKDGTLVDFHATWGEATHAVMQRMAGGDEAKFRLLAEVNHYDVAARRILPTSPLIAGSSADYGISWAEVLGEEPGEAFNARMDRLFVEEATHSVVALGAPRDILATLKREGYVLGIVTNDSEDGARAHCDKLGLTPWLDAIIGYDSGHGRKPEPGQIRAFAKKHGLTSRETALVGDSLHDLHAAKAVGVVGIAVLSGLAGAQELTAHADHVIPDIMALPALLRSLRRKT
jgi:phosphoglycolate phosphatase